MDAVKENSLDVVRGMLEADAEECIYDVDCTNEEGFTPLMKAAMYDNVSMVELLLNNGASVDQQEGRGRTALMLAAANGNTATMRMLLTAGGANSLEPHANNGWPAIMFAAANGHEWAVHELVKATGCAAQIALRAPDGSSALDVARKAAEAASEAGEAEAITGGHAAVVRFLEAEVTKTSATTTGGRRRMSFRRSSDSGGGASGNAVAAGGPLPRRASISGTSSMVGRVTTAVRRMSEDLSSATKELFGSAPAASPAARV